VTFPRQDLGPAESLTGTKLAARRGERIIFSGLDFRLDLGGAIVLKGPNGAGKSTLLRVVAGFLPLASGTLGWNGNSISDDPDAHRTRLCYLGHLDAVKPVFTVRENIAFWARMGGIADLDARMDAALDRFSLVDLADQPGRFLSAGQKRRTALARLGVSPAPLWLLDEPTVSLDTASVAALAGLIADHRSRGGMVMVATHIDLGFTDYQELDMRAFIGGDLIGGEGA